MKHPLWIINSTLLLFVVIAFLFIFFSQVSIPDREDIEPILYSKVHGKKELDINIAQIYEADLFGTFRSDYPSDAPQVPAFPSPPEPKMVEVPELPKPKFLDPLDITLRGIFAISTDSAKNRALIADNKTNQEVSYKIGDTIGDAQLIRIFSNKIILLRANGQQEVLYVREQDAKLDSAYANIDEWNTIIKQVTTSSFMIDPSAFAQRVQDLAQFIDMLRLITAFKQGTSIGCRIGHLDEKSVGTALGLQAGDIITAVNGTPANSMENRLKIYKGIMNKEINDSITVSLLRNKEEYSFEYILRELAPDDGQTPNPSTQFELKKIADEEKVKIMQQKHEFAPTLNDIRKRERENMKSRGTAPVIGGGIAHE